MNPDTLMISTASGQEYPCLVVWTEDDGKYVVAKYGGREFIAKRRLGAWAEVPLHEVAAKLNRIKNA